MPPYHLKMKPYDMLRSHRLGLVSGALYAAVLIYVGLRYHVMGDGDSETDFFGNYVPQARAFLDGHLVIDPYRGPFYPILLALLSLPLRLFGAGLFETGIVLSALASGIVVVFSHRIIHRLFSPGIAAVVIVFIMSNRYFIRYSYTTGNDMVFAALATLIVWAVVAWRREGWIRPAVVGALGGLTYLSRYNAVSIFVGVLAALLLVNAWRLPLRRRVTSALIIAATFLVVISPWGLYCLSERGDFFYSRNAVNIAFGFYVADETEAEAFFTTHGERFNNIVDVIAFDPARFFANLPGVAYEQFSRLLKQVMRPLGLIIWASLLLLLIRRPTRSQMGYYVIAAAFYLSLCLVFFNGRFNLFLIPMLSAFAVAGLTVVPQIIGRARRALDVAVALAIAGLLVTNAALSVPYNREALPGEAIGYRQFGEWFRGNLDAVSGGTVVARKPHFGYFAGLDTIQLPSLASEAELLSFLRSENADFLFFSPIAEATRPALAGLKYPDRPHPGLLFLHASTVGVLYAVQK